jgi:Ca2+:H+ antiporter
MQLHRLFKSSLDPLFVFLPIAIGLEYFAPAYQTMIFIASCLAIVPLAGLLGTATEQLASKTSDGLSGLLNATFGNAAELIISLAAIRQGLFDVAKASLTGAIIGNILLVLGFSILAGGLKNKVQTFNAAAARMQGTTLTLAAIALILPAMYHYLVGPNQVAREADLSTEISIVLIITYALGLLFSLRTHKHLFDGIGNQQKQTNEKSWRTSTSVLMLLSASALIGWLSEILVGSVETAAHTLGMTNVFTGVIVVAIIGNAAEHSTAIMMAMKNRMDMSVNIAVGSSIQVALFVAPVLVLLSRFIATKPMDLVFTPAEVIAISLSVFISGQVTSDGEANWMEGVQLISVYIILALVFYFMP